MTPQAIIAGETMDRKMASRQKKNLLVAVAIPFIGGKIGLSFHLVRDEK